MVARPVVLLPPDIEVREGKRGPLGYFTSQRPYAESILEQGGLPIIPPALVDAEALDQLVAMADGLVLPGGGFDIDPALYGEEKHPLCGELKPERTALEQALLKRAEARGMPVLGVCGGMQLMNVVRGGTLWQDLRAQTGTEVAHEQAGPKDVHSHAVHVVETPSRLRALVGDADLPVNSTHHQAVKTLGKDLVVTAAADDGIVEAFEDPARPFYVGVQWHPESMRAAAHRAIYRGLVEAARAFRAARSA
jgi:putative glutamine amidotransferase